MTKDRVKWILVGAGGVLLAAVIAAAIVLRVQEQQRAFALKKETERQQLAAQSKQFNDKEKQFRENRDLAARLEELRRATEREQFRFAHNLEIDPGDNSICIVGRINLFNYFSDDDLNFLLDRKNRYTVKYADIFDKGSAKANKELKEHTDELQRLADALRAYEPLKSQ